MSIIKEEKEHREEFVFYDTHFIISTDSLPILKCFHGNYVDMSLGPSIESKQDNNIKLKFHILANHTKQLVFFSEGEIEKPTIDIFKTINNSLRFPRYKIIHNEDNSYTLKDLELDNSSLFHIRGNACYFSMTNCSVLQIFQLIFFRVIQRFNSYYCLHAAAVAKNGKGTIICGKSGSGKTTTTMGLMRKGFKFLSDEIALINLSNNKVYPFPRSIGLRENLFKIFPELEDNPNVRYSPLYRESKRLINPSSIVPDALSNKVPLSKIIFLDGFSNKPKVDTIEGVDVLFKSTNFSHSSSENPFERFSALSSILKRIQCYILTLGDFEESINFINNLLSD